MPPFPALKIGLQAGVPHFFPPPKHATIPTKTARLRREKEPEPKRPPPGGKATSGTATSRHRTRPGTLDLPTTAPSAS